ncbi:MAG: protein MobC [Mailhella sp.]|nr:protein MobC [Mailhella sp.]
MIKTNTETVRKILAEFPNLQHEKKTLEGNHEMTFREAIRTLYPTLRDMKKRGFSTKELAKKLDEYGINIKPTTFSKYLNEAEQDEILKRNRVRIVRSTRRAKKPASQPATPVTDHALATPSETE